MSSSNFELLIQQRKDKKKEPKDVAVRIDRRFDEKFKGLADVSGLPKSQILEQVLDAVFNTELEIPIYNERKDIGFVFKGKLSELRSVDFEEMTARVIEAQIEKEKKKKEGKEKDKEGDSLKVGEESIEKEESSRQEPKSFDDF